MCLSARSSILAPGAQTAGLIGTGEAPFDVPERRKDDGASRGAIDATWHVPRANVPTLAKINCEALHIEPNDARQRSLVGRLSPWGDTCFWVFIALWHVSIYFINSFIAPERLVQSGPGRFQPTQFNDQNIAKSIASFSVPCATCLWHITRAFTLLLPVIERLNGFGLDRLCSAQNDDRKIMRSIALNFMIMSHLNFVCR